MSMTKSSYRGLSWATAFSAICLLVHPALSQTVTAEPPHEIALSDHQPYLKGSFLAWLDPWGANGLLQNKDYTNTMRIDPATFPAGSILSWSWPNVPAVYGVYSFLAINFGNTFNTTVKKPIPPRRVQEIAELVHSHAIEISGDRPNYNVIIDFWLTKEAGKHDVHLFEIEIFLHASDRGKIYSAISSQVGIYTDAEGRNWRVSVDRKRPAPDILFLPPADIATGKVDIKSMLLWLVQSKIISGQEWFNGLGTGVEVVQSNGSITVNALSVQYQ